MRLRLVASPTFDFLARIGQVKKTPRSGIHRAGALEALDVAIFDGLAGPDQVQFYTIYVGPHFHCLARELAAVVGGDRFRHAAQWTSRSICTTTFSPV